MALFLQTFHLRDRDPRQLLVSRGQNTTGVRDLKHWFDETGERIGILIEAPDAEAIVSAHPGATELTELTELHAQ